MAATDPTPTSVDDVSGLSYEAARAELVDIVARLEGGQVGLEDSMALWKRGEALAQHCEQWLQQAEATIRDGGPTATPATG